MSSPLIDIEQAEVWQGGTRVFDNLTLHIGRHENVAILGPNGAGKSTLIKLLCRDIYPVRKAGSQVRILGNERFDVQEYRHQLGIVSHALQVDHPPATTGREVVLSGFAAALGLHGIRQSWTRAQQARAQQLIAQLELEQLADRPYQQMSTGQQRRFLMARALAPQPNYLVLDEPTAGLDMKAAFAMLTAMAQAMSEGRSVVLATHHLHEIPAAVDRIILMKEGQIVADDRAEVLLTESVLSKFYDTELKLVEAEGRRFAIPAPPGGGN